MTENDIYFSSLMAAITKNHEYDIRTSDFEQLLGRKPTDLKTYLKETFLSYIIMKYVFLSLPIIFEVVGSSFMKASDGFTK